MFLWRREIWQSGASGERAGAHGVDGFPHITGDSFRENSSSSRLLCIWNAVFKDLIFILALQGGSLSWDQISDFLLGNPIMERQWIALELDNHRVKMFHATFINTAQEGQKEPIYWRQLTLTPFHPNDLIIDWARSCFFWEFWGVLELNYYYSNILYLLFLKENLVQMSFSLLEKSTEILE